MPNSHDMRQILLDKILSNLRQVTGLDEDSLRESTHFDEINLESLAITAFTSRLEPFFPGLRKTFVFECRSARGIRDYLLEKHPEQARIFAMGEPSAPAGTGKEAMPLQPAAPPANDLWDGGDWPDLLPLEAGAPRHPTAIAVIGMHGRFPGAPTLRDFWSLLREGRDAVGEIPADRWSLDGFFEPGTPSRQTGRSYAKWGGFLDGIDRFDAQFFGVSARDAAVMDPQERLFLECAWHAMEDAALAGERLEALRSGDGFDAGVFVGVTTTSYQLLGPEGWHGPAREVPTAMPWSVANRVSHALNLQGPSLAVDTACSSSLVALHYACDSLAREECRVAIAGGVNLYTHPAKLVQLCQHGMLSPSGHCHSFGSEADGFTPGEGVGALVLKPLAQALADGDRIHAVIRATSANHSGRTNGYTVPAAGAQARLVARALARGGVAPRSISYIEAHGTGTKLGDPIEVAGLTEALEAGGGGHPIGLGSVKANIGHLESAAGTVGIIKTILQMRHRLMAPSLHSRILNPALGLDGTRFFVPQAPTPWHPEPECGLLRAGVSSFGAGGANAHVVLEEAPTPTRAEPFGPLVFPLSARTPEQLRQLARALRARLAGLEAEADGNDVFAALAYTLQCGRRAFPHRLALAAADPAQLRRLLEDGATGPGIHRSHGMPGAETPALPASADETPDSLARRWAGGAEIRWHGLWRTPPRPVDAPLYPFQAERHWLRRDDDIPTRLATTRPDADILPLAGDLSACADHRIGGEAVLPATASLDACYRAVRGLGWTGTLEITDLAWLRPLPLARLATAPARLRLEREADGRRFELLSGEESSLPHVRGRCRPAPDAPPASAVDAAAVRARCRTAVEVPQAYAAFRRLGMDYGPAFQTLAAVWTGAGEALAEIRRPAGSPPSPGLDPAMLDGALQVAALAAGLLAPAGLPTAFIPISAGRLRVHGPLPERILAHAAATGGAAGGIRRFDYRITTPEGTPLVEIEDFAFRAVALNSAGQDSSKSAPPTALSLLQPDWAAEPLPADTAAPAPTGLVVVDPDRRLFDALRTGDGPARAWHVIPGRRFEIAGDSITCDLADRDNLDLLWRFLTAESALPGDLLINLAAPWPRPDTRTPDWREEAGIAEADLLPDLLASLCRTSPVPRFHATVLLDRPEAAAALAGALKSLHWEAAGTTARLITADAPLSAGQIGQELKAGGRDGVAEIRYRGGERQRRCLRFIDGESARPADRPVFTPRDVILVTGGAGAVAGHLLAALAGRGPARFVLIGRSPPGKAVRRQIDQLRQRGADAVYHQADCADAAQMAALLDSVRRQLGPVTGVIHAAGLLRDAFLIHQQRADWTAVLAAKIVGALVLDRLTAADPLRFFVLCSGLAGIRGNAGQTAYAFANAWLDRFAEQRAIRVAEGNRRGDSLSIAWPLWATESGMQAPEPVKAWLARNGLSLLSPEAGGAVFLDALAAPRPVLVPVAGARADIARLLEVPEETGARPAAVTAAAAPAAGPADDGALLAYLKGLIGEASGSRLDRIDAEAPLEVFGLDSLMVMEINTRLEERFPEVPKTALFEARSIRQLADLLIREYPQRAAAFLTPGAPPADASPAMAAPATVQPPAPSPFPSPSPSPRRGLDIAIVGIAGRYPGSPDPASLWRHLAAGDDLITEVPGRWNAEEAAGQGVYARWGGFLDDVDAFDPLFFGISPRDAERMDPQERLFLQAAWHAVEDAGYTPETLSNPRGGPAPRRRVGVIAGVMYGEYQFYGSAGGLAAPPVLANSSYASIANRVSFCLDLDGPSFAVDSMCSSSLTALHLACNLLRGGGCDIALAGGVNLSLHPYKYRMLCDLKFASTDGRCRSFGEGGDGYVPGEGVGVAVLRPLEDALAAGDHIHGIIKGSDIGHGGRTSGYTVPNAEAQAEVIARAFDQAGTEARRLGYVEAHGTGTSLGDPIELRGLVKALAPRLAAGQTCPIGSVKSNMGHLESAAGMAALAKVLLQLRHGTIAPSLHAAELNRNIDFTATPFRLARSAMPWPRPEDGPRLAAISSFGAGGANAHLVLEEAIPLPASLAPVAEPLVFALSARNAGQLAALAGQLALHLEAEMGDDPLRLGPSGVTPRDVALTLALGRRRHEHRLAIVAETFPDLLARLRRAAAGAEGDGIVTGQAMGGGAAEGTPSPAEASQRAAAWVSGAIASPVDTPAAGSWRKVPLPGYPFEKRRYWPPTAPALTVAPSPALQDIPTPEQIPAAPAPAAGANAKRNLAMLYPRIGIIGGGACGIGTAKALHQAGYDFEIIEATDRFGGNWQTSGPAAKMYDSAHLISSRRNTQFSDYPMPRNYPHYPRHGLMLSYLEDMARDFDLARRTRFNTTVEEARPSAGGGWDLRFAEGGGTAYDILIVCNGLLRKPLLPDYPGHFSGESLHAGAYRGADLFRGRRVLVVGGGNSGCDIAVDAALNARAAFHSTRRGYYYMPKFIDGRPTQEWLMDEVSRFDDAEAYWRHVQATFKLAGYDGRDYGLPAPDHAIQEAHPILNSQILYHIGHGDVSPKPDIARLDGRQVHFTDGTAETIDVIVWATGYDIDLPFLSPRVYDWQTRFPSLFLKMVPQEFDNLLFAGYLNTPSGIGNVANIMGKFVAAYVQARTLRTDNWHAFQSLKMNPQALDLGEARFMDTPRHKFEVDLWKFIKALNFMTGRLLEAPAEPASRLERAAS